MWRGAILEGAVEPAEALLDRVVMLLLGAKNLREITMFPMNQQAYDLLMNAPSEASPQQLRDLALRVAVPKKDA
jgi:aspartyl-tRNA synthetase